VEFRAVLALAEKNLIRAWPPTGQLLGRLTPSQSGAGDSAVPELCCNQGRRQLSMLWQQQLTAKLEAGPTRWSPIARSCLSQVEREDERNIDGCFLHSRRLCNGCSTSVGALAPAVGICRSSPLIIGINRERTGTATRTNRKYSNRE